MGVPSIQLDQQGRARPEIAALYAWRYQQSLTATIAGGQVKSLGNLPTVMTETCYQTANAGFAHTFQLIDVQAFQHKGETAPTPFFYQNLGEAEYVVAVYQYMRLIGYPAEKITILTTYNGQKHLIRDIIQQRCKNHKLFGFPHKITTVDKYQGQQNDYILLSLVRTESVGHLKDIRRLVVALSRARLGLYVFCRHALFQSCFELQTPLQLLTHQNRPTQLQLVVGEEFPTQRPSSSATAAVNTNQQQWQTHTVENVTAMGVLVYQMVQQASVIINSSSASSAPTSTSATTSNNA